MKTFRLAIPVLFLVLAGCGMNPQEKDPPVAPKKDAPAQLTSAERDRWEKVRKKFHARWQDRKDSLAASFKRKLEEAKPTEVPAITREYAEDELQEASRHYNPIFLHKGSWNVAKDTLRTVPDTLTLVSSPKTLADCEADAKRETDRFTKCVAIVDLFSESEPKIVRLTHDTAEHRASLAAYLVKIQKSVEP